MTDVVDDRTSPARVGPESPTVDRTAFEALVDRHHADLVRVAYAVCRDPDLASEAAQGAWLAAWRNAAAVRDPGRVRGWLVAIAANEARRLYRRERQRSRLEPASAPPGRPSVLSTDLDLVAALDRLDLADRALIAMRYGLDMDATEIAAAIGGTASGVRGRLSRLIARLRKDLDDA